MSKLLLIWEHIGDSANLYLLDSEEDAEAYAWAKASRGLYINSDDIPEDHPIFTLNVFLEDYNDTQYRISLDEWQPVQIDEVVQCGFVL